MKKLHVMLCVLFVTVLQIRLFGQVYNMGAPGARTVSGCNLIIYDNGGPSTYGNDRNDTMTILSGTPSTPSVKITIQEADIANDDSLFIYNSNMADPTKLVYMGSLNAPFLNNSNMIIQGDWSTYTTIDNPSGAITLRFKSNDANIGAGFKITVSCQSTCQRIYSYIDTIATTPTPHRLVPDDGFQYIDVCENQPVHLVGSAYFQDNDVLYHQTLDSSVLYWRFGTEPEISTPMGVNSINHTFLPVNGYDVSLNLKDQRQCINFNSAGVRIRTSANPIGHIDAISVCQGSSSLITFGYADTSNIVLIPVRSDEFFNNGSSMMFDSVMYIPDGANCPGMADCFNTFVNFSSFTPGAIVTSAADILSVCFKMEHSFLGDLQFKIICPNGQSVITHSQPNGGGLYLGTPIDGSNSCDSSPDQRGIGWNYCWSENPTYSYHCDTSATHYLHQNQFSSSCDSTNRQNHTNYYNPMNSFGNLVGCDLNGTWSVEICDLWGIDDGWIFEWQLNLDPMLLPTPWTYNIGIEQTIWSGSSITEVNDSSVVVTPTQPGLNSSLFTITDAFGCIYDTLINIYASNSFSNFEYLVTDTTNVSFYPVSSGEESYLWNFGVGNITSTETYPLFDYPSPGQYTVVLTTSNGACTSSTTQEILVSNTGIEENNSESINIYPIPTTGNITIQLGPQKMGITSIKIFDMTGKEVFSNVIAALDSDNRLELNLSSLVSGVYHIQLKNDANVSNKMILIKR